MGVDGSTLKKDQVLTGGIKRSETRMSKKFWIDTEFIEYPCTIDLISIGIER